MHYASSVLAALSRHAYTSNAGSFEVVHPRELYDVDHADGT